MLRLSRDSAVDRPSDTARCGRVCQSDQRVDKPRNVEPARVGNVRAAIVAAGLHPRPDVSRDRLGACRSVGRYRSRSSACVGHCRRIDRRGRRAGLRPAGGCRRPRRNDPDVIGIRYANGDCEVERKRLSNWPRYVEAERPARRLQHPDHAATVDGDCRLRLPDQTADCDCRLRLSTTDCRLKTVLSTPFHQPRGRRLQQRARRRVGWRRRQRARDTAHSAHRAAVPPGTLADLSPSSQRPAVEREGGHQTLPPVA